MSSSPEPRITVVENGPYVVSGDVPLTEQIITPEGHSYRFEEGRALPQRATYALCRCGHSHTKPFCDGSHEHSDWDGEEVADRRPYAERAEVQGGPDLDLADDGRCAFARFCHREDGIVWDLVDHSDDARLRKQAVDGANACPAGRLTAYAKDGACLETHDEPAIIVAQDPQRRVSAGLFVRGRIPLIAADGTPYELRERYALCRCGHSRTKPFCDAMHVPFKFDDTESTD